MYVHKLTHVSNSAAFEGKFFSPKYVAHVGERTATMMKSLFRELKFMDFQLADPAVGDPDAVMRILRDYVDGTLLVFSCFLTTVDALLTFRCAWCFVCCQPVYVSPTSAKVYHSMQSCRGFKSLRPTRLTQTLRQERRGCQFCVESEQKNDDVVSELEEDEELMFQ